jgi:hypothetical protein
VVKVEDAHRSRLRPLGVDDDAAPSAPDFSETGSMSSTSSPTDQVITSARKGKAKNKGQSPEAAQLDALIAQVAANQKQERRQTILVELQALQKLMKGDPTEPLYKEREAALKQQYKDAV